MKARILLPKYKYPITNKQPVHHGAFQYACKECGEDWLMFLEEGVEGKDKTMPCPFIIPCINGDCNGLAQHINWQADKKDWPLAPLSSGKSFFNKDDKAGQGVPMIYNNPELLKESQPCT